MTAGRRGNRGCFSPPQVNAGRPKFTRAVHVPRVKLGGYIGPSARLIIILCGDSIVFFSTFIVCFREHF